MAETVGLGTDVGGENDSGSIQSETTATEGNADASEQQSEESAQTDAAGGSDAAEDDQASSSETDQLAKTYGLEADASTIARPAGDHDSARLDETDDLESPAHADTDEPEHTSEQAATDSDVDWHRIDVEPERHDHLGSGESQIVDQGLTVDCISVDTSDDASEEVPQSAFSDSSSDGDEDEETDSAQNDQEDTVAEDVDAEDESLALTRKSSKPETQDAGSDVIMLDTYDPSSEPAPCPQELYDPHGFLQPLVPEPVDCARDSYRDARRADMLQDINRYFRRNGPIPRVQGITGQYKESDATNLVHWHGPYHPEGRRRARDVTQVKEDLRNPDKRRPSPLSIGEETSEDGGQGFSDAAERAIDDNGMRWSDFDEEEDERTDAEWFKKYTETESRRASEAGSAQGVDTVASATAPSKEDPAEASQTAEQVFGPSSNDNAAELARPPTRGKSEGPPQAPANFVQLRQEQVHEEQVEEPYTSPLSPEFFTGLELYTGMSAQEGYAWYKEWSSGHPRYNAKPGSFNETREELQTPTSYVDFDNPGNKIVKIDDKPQLSEEEAAEQERIQSADKAKAERALFLRRVRMMQTLTEDLTRLRARDPRTLSGRDLDAFEKIEWGFKVLNDYKDTIMLEIFKMKMLLYRYSRFVYRKQRDESREKQERYRRERNEAERMYEHLRSLMGENGLEGVPERMERLRRQLGEFESFRRGAQEAIELEQSKVRQAKEELRLVMQRHQETKEQLQSFEPLMLELEMERKCHDKAMKRAKVAEWKLQRAEESRDEIINDAYERHDKALAESKAEGEKALQLREKALNEAAKACQDIATLQAGLGKCRQQIINLESEIERLTRELTEKGAEASRAEVEQLQSDVERLQDRNESLEIDLVAQQAANEELTWHKRKSDKQAEGLQADLDGAFEQLAVADKRIGELDAELEQLKASNMMLKGKQQKVTEQETRTESTVAFADNSVHTPKRLPAQGVRPTRPTPIQTDSTEIVPQALPTSDVTRTPHHAAPIKTPILPGRPQAWVEREARLMQSQACTTNVQRRRELRAAREQVERQRIEEVRRALAASCGWEEMPYVPKAQRWVGLMA